MNKAIWKAERMDNGEPIEGEKITVGGGPRIAPKDMTFDLHNFLSNYISVNPSTLVNPYIEKLEKGIRRLKDLPITRIEIYKSELGKLLKEVEE